MPDRIANLPANNSLIGYILRTQRRLHDTNVQITSEKISQDYAGIARNSERLVTLENTRDLLSQYVSNNTTMALRFDIASTAIDAAKTSIQDFRSALVTFGSGGMNDPTQINDIQDWAVRAMKDLQGYLNTTADGRYMFGGTRVTDKPVELGLSTRAAFQATYDGSTVTYPTTRDGHLGDYTITKDVVTGQKNWLTFARDSGGVSQLTSSSNGDFANVKVGNKITVSGTTSNNGTYTVASVNGTTNVITVVTEMLTDETNVGGTLTFPQAPPTHLDPELTIAPAATGDLTFNRAGNTIVALNGGTLSTLPVGAVFTVSGTASNDGTYTVATNDGTTLTIDSKKFTNEGGIGSETMAFTSGAGEITFTDNTPAADTIVGNAGRFSALSAGMRIVVTGSTGNNGTYTVGSVNGTGSTVTLVTTDTLATAAPDAAAVTFTTQESAGTIAANAYYSGNEVALTHRVDDDRSLSYDLTGVHPAFEKAIRAMGTVAQGVYRTEGGLDQNTGRVSNAIYLLNVALEATVSGTPPYGAEVAGSMESLQMDLGFDQVLLNRTTDSHNRFIGFLESRISETENIDKLEAVERLLDDSRALEASYQALARIRSLSLSDFIT
jgi:flagellar hook-associated protein 3 FlgL